MHCVWHLSLSMIGLLGLAACSEQGSMPAHITESESAILGGQATTAGQYPTVVALVVGDGLCTGTLIAPDVILTAAHCVDPGSVGFANDAEVAANMNVIFDSSNLSQPGGFALGARQTIPHPNFNEATDPDIGIIKLKTPVTDRTPSPVNFDSSRIPVGTGLTLVGFGIADDGNAGREFALANMPTVSCSEMGVDGKTFLCFDQRGGDGKCNGDSGGPSFLNIDGALTVVGVTSFGDQNCEFYGADMRVDAAADFIRQNAPEALCGENAECNAACGLGELPVDPDCPVCATNDECGEGSICEGAQCVPAPLSPGGAGALCGEGEGACLIGQCATGPGGSKRCVESCTTADECPETFSCLPAGNTGACWPDDPQAKEAHIVDSGCSTGGTSGGVGVVAFALALLAIGFTKRPRLQRAKIRR